MLSTSRRATLPALPDDVLLLLLSYVAIPDILSLRKTCKHLCTMSKLRWVWYDAIKRHVVEEGLPIPAAELADLKGLSAEHLEARAVHVTSFHNNWNSSHPRTRKIVEFAAVPDTTCESPDDHRTAVTHVSFLSGSNGQLLVTSVGRVLTCWEVPLGESEAYRVAEWVTPQKIEQVIVNDDPKSGVVVALVSAHPTNQNVVECRAFSLDKFHGRFQCRMELRAHRQVVMPLHTLHDDYMVFGDPLHVCYFTAPSVVKPLGRTTLADQPDNRVLAVRPINRYLLIVRQRTFEVVPAPIWKGVRVLPSPASSWYIEMDVPATSSTIVFRANSHTHADEVPDWPTEPVTVLSRYSDEGFETLHQYDLLPNPAAKPANQEKSPDVLSDRLPCTFPTRYTRVMSVAPSCCNFCVGPSGKGFWIETRNITIRHTRTPARCLVGFTVRPDLEQKTAHIRMCEDTVYARRCNIHEILWKKYIVTSTAFEDTVGRIAVGDVMGKVEVLDLAF